MSFSRPRKYAESEREMIYVSPPPSSAYGEWRLSKDYAPALRSRDYKDPILVIEIEYEFKNPAGDTERLY